MFSLTFSQNNDFEYNAPKEYSFSIRGIKAGIDFNDTFSAQDWPGSIGLRHTPSIAAEINTSIVWFEQPLIIGAEHMLSTKMFIKQSSASVSHTSLYTLYNFFESNSVVLNAKFGFSTFNISGNGNGVESSSGGLMYGFQLELNDYLHVSYTIHNGSYKSENDNYFYSNSETYKTKTSRLNIAYKFDMESLVK
tara:strand:- start:89 stop:667 length:579 start_codon:yes stop_codon:yes gene_type:complete